MADINFDCPHCGHNLDVNERGAGLTVACPECSNNIEIPVPELLMSNIRFNCESCRQSLEAPPDMAGQLIDCPTCKQPTKIPFASRPTPPTPTRPAAKALVCELCGKSCAKNVEDVYVCCHCETKYSVENAKRLMVEVSLSTLKSITSDEFANLYKMARRAYNKGDFEDSAKYYDMILGKNSNSWEAQFYAVFCQAMSCRFSDPKSAAYRVGNYVDTVLELIKENYDDPDERYKRVYHVAARVIEIEALIYYIQENYLKRLFEENEDEGENYKQTYIYNVFATKEALYKAGDFVEVVFADDPKICEIAAFLWRVGILQHAKVVKYLAKKDENIASINNYAEKVKKYHPEYMVPEISTSSSVYMPEPDCRVGLVLVLFLSVVGIGIIVLAIVYS